MKKPASRPEAERCCCPNPKRKASEKWASPLSKRTTETEFPPHWNLIPFFLFPHLFPRRKPASRSRRAHAERTAQVKTKGLVRKCRCQPVLWPMCATLVLSKPPIMCKHLFLLQVTTRSRRHWAGKRSLPHLSSTFVFFPPLPHSFPATLRRWGGPSAAPGLLARLWRQQWLRTRELKFADFGIPRRYLLAAHANLVTIPSSCSAELVAGADPYDGSFGRCKARVPGCPFLPSLPSIPAHAAAR